MGTTPLKTRRRPRGPVEAFGPRLRRIREARGFSQGQLGLAIGASQRMIAYYESHAEKAPARHLAALAQVLRVSVDELVGYRPVDTPAGRAIPGCGIGCARSRPCRPRIASRSCSSSTPSSSGRRSRSGRPGAAKKEPGSPSAERGGRSDRIDSVSTESGGRTQQADSYKTMRAR
jgi:transcriptional regulator with XRE-family HTH domain